MKRHLLRRVLLVALSAALCQVGPSAAERVEYQYDEFGRLKAMSHGDGRSLTYNYDATDNRTSVTGTAASVSVSDAEAVEGQALRFEVTLSNPITGTVVLRTVDGGSANPSSDYWPVDQTVVFDGEQQSQTVYVGTVNNSIQGPVKTVFVELYDASDDIVIARGTGVGRISDDEPSQLSITDQSANEGEPLEFTIQKSGSQGGTVKVDMQDMSATGGQDYSRDSLTIEFAPEQQSVPIYVKTLQDTKYEGQEHFRIYLHSPTGGVYPVAGLDDAVGTIVDDESESGTTITISDASASEGGVLNYEILKSGPNTGTLGVYITSGSATMDVDYSNPGPYGNSTGLVFFEFKDGETSKTYSIETIDDAEDEQDETINVVIYDPSPGLTIEDGAATGTILDDDPHTVSISDAQANEGDDLIFAVTKAGGSSGYARVETWTGGTASEGSDYSPQSNYLIFDADESTKQFAVTTFDDSASEGDETVVVKITETSPSLYAADASAVGTIIDDEQPTLLLGDAAAVSEGSVMVFPIYKTPGESGSVTFRTTTNGTATAGVDFVEKTQSITLEQNEEVQYVAVTTVNDSEVETDESVVVELLNPSSGWIISDSSGVGSIEDDDWDQVTVHDAAEYENGGALVFYVTKDGTNAGSLSFQTVTGGSATPNVDYQTVSTTVVFSQGETSKQVSVPIIDDNAYEHTESMYVEISSPTAGLIISNGSAVGQIYNDEAPDEFNVSDASADEGQALAFQITRTGTDPAWVTFETVPGGGTASANDYSEMVVYVNFAAGESSRVVHVPTTQDSQHEPTETVHVTLSSPSAGSAIGDGFGVGAIFDDDPDDSGGGGESEAPNPPHDIWINVNRDPNASPHARNYWVLWEEVEGADEYRLFESIVGQSQGGPGRVPLSEDTATSKFIEDKPPGEYEYSVRACYKGLCSDAVTSSDASITVCPEEPATCPE